MSQLEQLRLQLVKYNQEHLFAQLDNLKDDQLRNELIDEIKSIDLEAFCKAFQQSDPRNVKNGDNIDSLLQPLGSDVHQSVARTSPEELDQLRSVGLNAISEGKVAALLLAGGQGTRLGFQYPKGMYDVGLPSKKTLYQIQAERIRRLEESAQLANGKSANIPWYIMTSGHTVEPTIEFFKKNDYFGLDSKNVIIFEQFTLPCFTFDGKIILDQPSKIARAPNGNGGLFQALRAKGILDDMKTRGIEHIHVYCVDNILVKVTDPVFIGYCIGKQVGCAAKVVEKVYPNEALGIICNVKGTFKVVEYSEVSHQTAQKRNSDGRLLFNAGNICNHYFSLDFLTNEIKEDQLMHHIAKKKIPYIDSNGTRVKPDKPNGIKLEKFVFDSIEFAKKFAIWEVLREDEFAPLKNSDESDKDTPTTSRLSLFNLHQRYVLNAGGKFVDENGSTMSLIPSPAMAGVTCGHHPDTNNNHVESQVVCEISPLTSYDGEGLTHLVQGKSFRSPLLL